MSHLWSAVFLAVLLVLTAPASADDAVELTFTSYSPQDYRPMVAGDYRRTPVELIGQLWLPPGDGPFPAVIVMHGSGGFGNLKPWYKELARALNEVGIAAFMPDSFGGRGFGNTHEKQGRMSIAANVLDAFMAFEMLAARPEIDAARIGVTGYSRGGMVSLFSAFKRLSDGVLGPDRRFAAHLPVYPSCQTRWDDATLTGVPMLMLLGGQDNYTPAQFCLDLTAQLNETAGRELVRAEVYPGAHHGWVGRKRQATLCRSCAVFSKCGLSRITDDGVQLLDGVARSDQSDWDTFVRKVFKACGKRGATSGGNREARKRTRDATVAFFRAAFGA